MADRIITLAAPWKVVVRNWAIGHWRRRARVNCNVNQIAVLQRGPLPPSQVP